MFFDASLATSSGKKINSGLVLLCLLPTSGAKYSAWGVKILLTNEVWARSIVGGSPRPVLPIHRGIFSPYLQSMLHGRPTPKADQQESCYDVWSLLVIKCWKLPTDRGNASEHFHGS